MKKVVTLVMGVICSTQLHAAANWYVFAEAGVAKSNVDSTDIDKALVQQQLDARAVHVDDSDSAFALHLGYQLKPHFAVELGYMDLGERVVDITGKTEDVNAFYQSTSDIYPQGGKGLSLALASDWALPYENVSITGRVGLFDWRGHYDGTSLGQRVSDSKISGIDTWFGASLNYQFEADWQASLNIKRVNLQHHDNTVFTLGLSYQF